MLRSAKDMMGFQLKAKDGEIGRSKDFLFDDEHWTIRYLLADTGGWLLGRRVLISPISMDNVDKKSKLFSVDLTKRQIEQAPSEAEDAPVSRQFEIEFFNYHQWPFYWSGGGHPWGVMESPQGMRMQSEDSEMSSEIKGDKHLRSMNVVRGYYIEAEDGEIGHIEDFIVDDETWAIRYIVVDTRNWLPGKKVLVSPSWAKEIDWALSHVQFGVSREQIKNSPEYDVGLAITRDYEDLLYDYYGLVKYWSQDK